MTTRAGSAAKSLLAKQTLIKVLFSSRHSGSGLQQHNNNNHRLLDHSAYSYDDLRVAYLKRVQQLHPDKCRTTTNPGNDIGGGVVNSEDAKHQFVELKDAWNRYEHQAKALKRVAGGGETNFTMFGVGCSFCDNDDEKTLRNEIMDQACRGWFSAGALTDRTEEQGGEQKKSTSLKELTLCDDELFVNEQEIEMENTDSDCEARRKSRIALVSHLIHPSRRNFGSASLGGQSRRNQERPGPAKRYFSDLSTILQQVQQGILSSEEAMKQISSESASGGGNDEVLRSFANLDHGRATRTGFPEAVFGEGKSVQQVAFILDDMARRVNESALGDALSAAILATR
jgi:hypothetical protein